MHGHPLEFQARLDGGEGPEFKGLADAQADGKGDLVFAVSPPVHQHIGGKALTLYDKDKNHYASIDVEGDIDAALDKAYNDYGLKVGLAELGSTQLCNRAGKDLVNALYVGLHKVQGVPCHHLAFDRKDIHYQVWIEAGDKPVVRKIVITQKKLPDSPQWTAYLSDWNLAPSLSDDLFAFTPPAGAEKIKFVPVKKTEAPAPKKGKAKKKGGQS